MEWRTVADEPNRQTYRGCDGVRRFAVEISEAGAGRFDDVMAFEDFIDLWGPGGVRPRGG
jgi:hypothetical protein